jgi:WD40 repeat protein
MKNEFFLMNVKGMAQFMLLLLIAAPIISCSLFSGKSAEPIPSKELIFPKAEDYNALVNTNHGLTVLLVGGDRGDLQSYARENAAEFTEFNFPNDPSCGSVKYNSHETLADGRLQVWEWCLTSQGGAQYIRIYDWGAKQLERLAGPLPLGSSGVSWNPDQTQGIVYLDSRFATKTLYWLSQDGFSPLNLVITDGSHSWNLKDDFPDFKADDTGKTGSTGEAAWSPDGKAIAFFASPNAVGKTGFQRFGVEYYLYLMDPETLGLSAVSENIYSPFLIQWSPDSTNIAFIGKYGYWKENGLWLYSLKDKSIINIAKGRFQGLAWTSNKSLAAIYCENIGVCTQILEYDLTSVVEP